jgi:hypothetical protein
MRDNLTEIFYVIDQSGSMAATASDVIGGFNTFLREQKDITDCEANLSLAFFDDHYHLVHSSKRIQDVPELTSTDYRPGGMTALLDSIGKSIDDLGKRLAATKEGERAGKILVIITTDGFENASRAYQHYKVMEMINHQRDKYSWNFSFIGAGQDAIQQGASMGFAAGQIYSYTPTSFGTQVYFQNASAGVSNFRRSKVVLGDTFSMVDPAQSVITTGNAAPIANQIVVNPDGSLKIDTGNPTTLVLTPDAIDTK